MPPREPLNLLSERLDHASSSHRNGDLSLSPPRPLVRYLSTTAWILSSLLDRFFTRTHYLTATATVTVRRPARSRSPSFPLTCHELLLNWMSLLTRCPILGPITRNRTRRPVARDVNGRSLMRQLPRVFRRPFPTFLDPSHGFLPLSGLHCRVLHGIRSRVSRPVEDSSSRQPPGSTAAANIE